MKTMKTDETIALLTEMRGEVNRVIAAGGLEVPVFTPKLVMELLDLIDLLIQRADNCAARAIIVHGEITPDGLTSAAVQLVNGSFSKTAEVLVIRDRQCIAGSFKIASLTDHTLRIVDELVSDGFITLSSLLLHEGDILYQLKSRKG
jgi:hypothetical protein